MPRLVKVCSTVWEVASVSVAAVSLVLLMGRFLKWWLGAQAAHG
jgi:hypothetical protein